MLRNYAIMVAVLAMLAWTFQVPQDEEPPRSVSGGERHHAITVSADDANQSQVLSGPVQPGALQEDQGSGEGVTLQRQGDGHFYADLQVNGATLRMLVDTGASGVALSRADAEKAGIGVADGMANVIGQGAGGEVRGKFVSLDSISLGSKTVQNIPAAVLDGGGQSLLGQTFLSEFDSIEIHGDTMVLR